MNQVGENNIKNLLDQLVVDENEELIEEINSQIFDSELYIILNDDNIMALTTEDGTDYLIPVFSDYSSVKVAFDDLNDKSLEIDIAAGEEILSLYYDDELFMGLAINPPVYDYVLPVEDVEIVEQS